jgi:hypothetical protein
MARRSDVSETADNGAAGAPAQSTEVGKDYVLPLVHLHIPEPAVNAGFWGALLATAALGVVDLPLVALIGAGMIVARHRVRPKAQ